jgi:hypothetical protein
MRPGGRSVPAKRAIVLMFIGIPTNAHRNSIKLILKSYS